MGAFFRMTAAAAILMMVSATTARAVDAADAADDGPIPAGTEKTKLPNFTGEWKLNVARSSYGAFPKPQSMVRKIAHADPLLAMTTTQVGAQGEVTSQLTYTTDGKPATNRDSKGTAVWQGDRLAIESSREFQGAVLKQKDVWSLSRDGNTLTVETHVSIPNGEFDVKQIFEKQ